MSIFRVFIENKYILNVQKLKLSFRSYIMSHGLLYLILIYDACMTHNIYDMHIKCIEILIRIKMRGRIRNFDFRFKIKNFVLNRKTIKVNYLNYKF